MLYGKDINATQTEKYDFVIKIASGIIYSYYRLEKKKK